MWVFHVLIFMSDLIPRTDEPKGGRNMKSTAQDRAAIASFIARCPGDRARGVARGDEINTVVAHKPRLAGKSLSKAQRDRRAAGRKRKVVDAIWR